MCAERDQALIQFAIDGRQLGIGLLDRGSDSSMRKGFSNGRLTSGIGVPVEPGSGQRRVASDQGSVPRRP
jgi:hypothetical protein